MAESTALPERLWLEAGLPLPRVRQLDVMLTQLLAQRAGVAVEAEVLPWRRCLTEVREGRMQGILGLSYSLERAQWAQFPMKGGQLDDQARVWSDAYHWYVRALEPWRWEAGLLKGPVEPRVAAVAGYSVVNHLQAEGVTVGTQVPGSPSALRMLTLNRVDAAALLRTEADPLLRSEPDLAARVVRLEPALLERSYHLAFAIPFARANGPRVSKLWAALPQLRESSAWKAAEAQASSQRQGP
ncbi:substrate-binding periplasmic protein [Inhella gelatinilytica]|uniref:Transporter substrate-binding domain-containing protein n=1 Tax=Inhella gelatinilytica TaxID=2795030 RepID=A0A931IV33_9BURK|nr:transporter substrate-binding domain-containing protein [Inhella gelatinilytica]MBH9552492.1 transporter substrate-binding domain-containing protein [Inhella gelatinilytica]